MLDLFIFDIVATTFPRCATGSDEGLYAQWGNSAGKLEWSIPSGVTTREFEGSLTYLMRSSRSGRKERNQLAHIHGSRNSGSQPDILFFRQMTYARSLAQN